MKTRILALLASTLLAADLGAQITTKRVASGMTRILWAGAPRGDARIFVGLKGGRIRIVKNGVLTPNYFLDISTKVSGGSEQGLLGVAFHPDYATNGLFYVNYTDLSGDTVVSAFQVTANPDIADPASEFPILRQSQPFENHNGGDLHFGPDGYLYVFFGDGGSANDPGCRAQRLDTWLGKILRIDVNTGAPYGVPADNPFVGVSGALPEIYHYGLRNPWRNSFDRLTGDLWIGDVGQDLREEIDVAPAGQAGLNFGWKMMEGTRCNSTTNCGTVPPCNDPSLVPPVTELLHSAGSFAITGGYVYRGCLCPGEVGKYFFADSGDNKIRSFEYDVGSGTLSNFQDRTVELAPGGGQAINAIVSFGEDGFGELLIIDHSSSGNGEVFKMVPAGAPGALAVARNGSGLNRTCLASTSLPILGSALELAIDTSSHPGATSTVLVGYAGPQSGIFLAPGELLVAPGSGRLFRSIQVASGGIDVVRLPVPCDAALSGLTAYTQVAVLGGQSELCNAVDITLGYY